MSIRNNRMTRNRIRALKATLLTTASYRYPYDDRSEANALREMGLLDGTYHITLPAALMVLSDVASTGIGWLAVEETQRVLNEIKLAFPHEVMR
jgi:hypothetical protein